MDEIKENENTSENTTENKKLRSFKIKNLFKKNADMPEAASDASVVDNIKNLLDAHDKAQEALFEINKKVSDRMTEDIKILFDHKAKEGYLYIDQKSREFLQKDSKVKISFMY